MARQTRTQAAPGQEESTSATPSSAAPTVLAPVLLHRNYWPDENTRCEKGTIVEVPATEARRLVELGVAERADPYPGEEGYGG